MTAISFIFFKSKTHTEGPGACWHIFRDVCRWEYMALLFQKGKLLQDIHNYYISLDESHVSEERHHTYKPLP